MKEEDQKYLIEKVELKWHGRRIGTPYECICGEATSSITLHIKKNQLDPYSPADMAKIWKAIKKNKSIRDIDALLRWLWEYSNKDYFQYALLLTYTPDLAQAMLEYFKEKGA